MAVNNGLAVEDTLDILLIYCCSLFLLFTAIDHYSCNYILVIGRNWPARARTVIMNGNSCFLNGSFIFQKADSYKISRILRRELLNFLFYWPGFVAVR